MDTPTLLYLVRHGESMLNTAGIVQGMDNDSNNHLTEKGRAQAKLVARLLPSASFSACYCSPHVRTQETAHFLLEGNPVPFFIENDLQEKKQGKLTGLTKQDFFKRYANWDSVSEEERLDIKIVPDEESQRELWERAKKVLLRIASERKGESILAVTHGGLMRAVYQQIKHISFLDMWTFHNCGYMVLSVSDHRMEIKSVYGLHKKEVKDFSN